MKIKDCPECMDHVRRAWYTDAFRQHVEHLSAILDETPRQVVIKYLSTHHALGHPSPEEVTDMVIDAVTAVIDKLDKATEG